MHRAEMIHPTDAEIERACQTIEKWIEAARNANQDGEDKVLTAYRIMVAKRAQNDWARCQHAITAIMQAYAAAIQMAQDANRAKVAAMLTEAAEALEAVIPNCIPSQATATDPDAWGAPEWER